MGRVSVSPRGTGLFTLFLALALLAGMLPAGTARAAALNVGCVDGLGDSQALVSAITSANTGAGSDTITLVAGCVYPLAVPINGPDGPTGLPAVQAGGLTINGNGATIIRSAGTPAFRILQVEPGASLALNNLTLTGGDAEAGQGGAVLNRGQLTLDGVTLRENRANLGAGLANLGSANLVRSLLFANTAADDGGGALNAAGAVGMTVESSTISQNVADGNPGLGGGIFNAAPLTLNNATIAQNSADQGGGLAGGSMSARNSIIAANSAPSGSNCANSITNQGQNLQHPGSSCGSITSADPRLAPLADNGGPSLTYGLRSASPAIGTANEATCAGTDQRGFTRADCDIGAFEQGRIFLVTNAANGGNGSLRAAIASANAMPNGSAPDVIYFQYGSGGKSLITVTSPLPTITEPVIIDGWTQTGFNGQPLIFVEGASAMAVADGLRFNNGGIARGVGFGRFKGYGIRVAGGHVIVQGTYLGLSLSGSTARPNAAGIMIESPGRATVGGLRVVERNIITANSGPGVLIICSSDNIILGNYIGLRPNGLSAMANTDTGVVVRATSPLANNNIIGGLLPGAANTISGNSTAGVRLEAGAVGTRIQGNMIGVNPAGTALMPNTGPGVRIDGANGSLVGTGNLIAGNAGDGVEIFGASLGNRVIGGRIYANDGLGIDLAGNGISPNDSGDGDSGPNRLQNFPVIDQVVEGLSSLAISGSLNSAPNQSFRIDAYANAACDSSDHGEGQVYLGTTQANTGSNGMAGFTLNLSQPAGAERWVTLTATDSAGNTSEFSRCAPVLANDVWVRAADLSLDGGFAQAGQSIAYRTQERWFKFPVRPGSRVSITLTGAPGNVLSLHRDPNKVYEQLGTPRSAPTEGAANLPGTFLPGTFLPGTFLPGTFLPGTFLPGTFLPGTFLPGTFLPGTFLPGTFLPERYSGATIGSLIAVAYDPQATSLSIQRNTWDLSEDLYIRVVGQPGVPFTLSVTITSQGCANLAGVPSGLQVIAGAQPSDTDRRTLLVWDETHFANGDPGANITSVRNELQAFAGLDLPGTSADIRGALINLSAREGAGPKFPRVDAARAIAIANEDCAAAQNQLAAEIKRVIDAYRSTNLAPGGGTTLEYIVLIGNNNSIPYFSYPDNAGIGAENSYFPPVRDDSATNATLRENRVIGQDAYGSVAEIWRGSYGLPIADLAVGRLSGDDTSVIGLLQAYTQAGGIARPNSALVTGYDFVADGAGAVRDQLAQALNSPPRTLIQPVGEPPTGPNVWTGDDLREQLFNQRNDLVFFTGHFAAGGLLAADYATGVLAGELANAPASFTNSFVFALGCHSGFNIPGPDGIANFSPEPDWPEAFAARGATYVGATGYAYGDTDLVEYGERLMLNLTNRIGTGEPVALGRALVDAKRAYIGDKATLSSLDEKTLLQFVVHGLPMWLIDTPGAISAPSNPSLIDSSDVVDSGPGVAYGLGRGETAAGADEIVINPTHSLVTKNLTPAGGGAPVQARFYQGGDGTVSAPLEPILPLELRNVSLGGQVLRGVGFRGGSYATENSFFPLTGSPATEESRGHVPFYSQQFYPAQPWSFNLTDAIGGGETMLAAITAQFRSNNPDSVNGTLRRYSQMRFRLYYLDQGWPDSPNANLRRAAVAAPPQIVLVESQPSGSNFQIKVYLTSDSLADLQDVWITHTNPASPGTWASIDLAPVPGTPGLWQATASLPASSLFMVQAANATGRVTIDTNNGALYPVTPPATGALRATAIDLVSADSSVAYGETAEFQVRLREVGAGNLANQRLRLLIGGQLSFATTNSSGVATFRVLAGQVPGSYDAQISFDGASGLAGSRLNPPIALTVTKAPTSLGITPPSPAPVPPGASSGIVATLTDQNGTPLPDRTVVFLATGASEQAFSVKTDRDGRAVLGPLPWPGGSYQVTAYFATDVPFNSGLLRWGDLFYEGSQATSSVTLNVQGAGPPTTTATVSGPQRPECPADCFIGEATVSFSVDLPGTTTRYRVNEGAEQIYSEPFVITTEGENTVEFFSTGPGLQDEEPKTITVKVTQSPATSILDSFNRPNSATLNGNWSGLATKDYRIVGNQVDVGAGGDITWNSPAAGFGANQEAYVRLTSIDPGSRHHTLMLKVQNGDWGQGAILVAYNAVDQTIDVEVRVSGGWETIASFPATMQPGDILGAQALEDGSVKVYLNCTLVGEADTTSSAAGDFYVGRGGRIGLWFIDATNAAFDDFGGGDFGEVGE